MLVVLFYLSSQFDVKVVVQDTDTATPGIAYGFVLRSREDRPQQSPGEVDRALTKAR